MEYDQGSSEEDHSSTGSYEDLSTNDDSYKSSDSSSEHDSDTDCPDSVDSEQPWYWQILIDEALDRQDEEKKPNGSKACI